MRLIFFIALRHLVSRRRQSVVAVLGMAISVTVLVCLTGLMKGFEHKFLGETLKASPHVTITDEELRPPWPIARRALGSGALAELHHERPTERTKRIKRPHEVLLAAEQLPGVIAGARQLVGQSILAIADQTYPVELRGIDPIVQERVTPISDYVISGRYDALDTTPDGIILGSGVAEQLGAQVGDRLTASATRGARVSLKVVAIFEAGIPPIDKNRAFVLLRAAQSIFRRPDEVNSIGFRMADTDAAPALARVIGELSGYKTESWQEQNANWLGVLGFQQVITKLVVGFLLVVAAFGILNILIMIVLEKRRDIAILRSIGLTRSQIQWIFLLQGLLMGLIGALLGCLLACVLVDLMQRVPVHFEGLIKTDRIFMHVEPWYYTAASAFAMGAGLVASILPARRAAATEPVDVLRGTA